MHWLKQLEFVFAISYNTFKYLPLQERVQVFSSWWLSKISKITIIIKLLDISFISVVRINIFQFIWSTYHIYMFGLAVCGWEAICWHNGPVNGGFCGQHKNEYLASSCKRTTRTHLLLCQSCTTDTQCSVSAFSFITTSEINLYSGGKHWYRPLPQIYRTHGRW